MDSRDAYRTVLMMTGKYNLPPTSGRPFSIDLVRLERDLDHWVKTAPNGIKISSSGEVVAA